MSEYTSTREGFQRAMEWSLTGPPEEFKQYAEAMVTPSYYQVMNGDRLSYDDFVNNTIETRRKTTEYKPVV